MIDDIRREVEERIREEFSGAPDLCTNDDGELDFSKIVRTCLNFNVEGDAFLYSQVHKDTFLYNATTGEMMIWGGHSWEFDIKDAHYAAVSKVADV